MRGWVSAQDMEGSGEAGVKGHLCLGLQKQVLFLKQLIILEKLGNNDTP